MEWRVEDKCTDRQTDSRGEISEFSKGRCAGFEVSVDAKRHTRKPMTWQTQQINVTSSPTTEGATVEGGHRVNRRRSQRAGKSDNEESARGKEIREGRRESNRKECSREGKLSLSRHSSQAPQRGTTTTEKWLISYKPNELKWQKDKLVLLGSVVSCLF